MTDTDLMSKYNLSAAELRVMVAQLLASGHIHARDIERRTCSKSEDSVRFRPQGPAVNAARKTIVDGAEVLGLVRSGASNAELMRKYQLSPKGLQSLFTKLLGLGLVPQQEWDRRSIELNSASVQEDFKLAGAETITLDLIEVLAELESGADRAILRQKYSLTNQEIDRVFAKIIEENLVTRKDLDRLLSRPLRQFQIRNRFSGVVIHEGHARSIAGLLERAVAQEMDLSEADLRGLDLSRGRFSGARLSRADLSKTILIRADLTGAQLSGAELLSADLFGSVLFKANLAGTNLSDANLSMSNAAWSFLQDANLAETNLSYANLFGANLSGARVFETILVGANLTGAYLDRVNLNLAKGVSLTPNTET
jgi:uncharacterized protein YjbI with pentapeptide repeats